MEHNAYEIIDRLCTVTNALVDITKMQAEIIAQMELSEKVEKELAEMRLSADRQLDIIEHRLRQIRR